MLSATAKETGTWLIGGVTTLWNSYHSVLSLYKVPYQNGMHRMAKFITLARYIILRVPDPPQNLSNINSYSNYVGELVAIHRKVHLFDIDIPGKIKFKVDICNPVYWKANFVFSLKESETLTGGNTTNYFDTGKKSHTPLWNPKIRLDL